MKVFASRITTFFLIIICLANCTACQKTQQKASESPLSILERVKDDGIVIIGIGQEAAPFGFRDKKDLVGFDIDIARAVVGKLEKYCGRKLKFVFKSVTDESRIGWVQSGEVHMSLCHTNITRKREANIDFTVPYGWDGKGVMYDLRRGKKKLSDFAGKVIGIKRSSSSEGEIYSYFRDKNWEMPILRQFDNHAEGILALDNGQIDGFTDDNSIIISTAVRAGHKVGPNGKFAVTDTHYSPAYFGIGVPENDSDWRDILNYCLHDLWNTGEYLKIYEKWFGEDSICPLPIGKNGMKPFVKG